MKKLMLACAVIAALTGCAVQKTMVPTGGSRSDGTIKLSYEFDRFEVPHVDEQQGLAVATKRCAAWGYTGTEAFGGQTKTCALQGSGCARWLVTVEYQCTGTPTPSKLY